MRKAGAKQKAREEIRNIVIQRWTRAGGSS